jgi:hypothetical protein
MQRLTVPASAVRPSEAAMPKFNDFRNFLDRNEIIFKTITATTLTAMAIIVSAAQLFTAREQVLLAEASALPQFEIRIHSLRDEASGRYDENQLFIENTGGPIHELDVSTAVFAHVQAWRQVQSPSVEFDLPVNGYFFSHAVTGTGKGLLMAITGGKNNATFSDLIRRTRDLSSSQNWNGFLMNEHVYIHLTYRDLLDRAHDDYYKIPLVGGASRIPDYVGAQIFQRWRVSILQDLSRLSPEGILSEAVDRLKPKAGTK